MTASAVSTYTPRPITFQQLVELDGWRLKLYGISARSPEPPTELLDAARRLAAEALPSPDGLPGVGFVGAHEGSGGCYVFVDWWADENELHHVAFSGTSAEDLRPIGPGDAIACVWDLEVIDFERRAWMDDVLRQPGASLDGYLSRRLTSCV